MSARRTWFARMFRLEREGVDYGGELQVPRESEARGRYGRHVALGGANTGRQKGNGGLDVEGKGAGGSGSGSRVEVTGGGDSGCIRHVLEACGGVCDSVRKVQFGGCLSAGGRKVVRHIKHVSGVHDRFHCSNVQQVQRQRQSDRVGRELRCVSAAFRVGQLTERRNAVERLPAADAAGAEYLRLQAAIRGGE